uniref:RGA 3.2 n=1 Tax=Solanum demissum TaxID=50514 RepID=A0A191UMS3_SOLDE|nr:RGA 3.2 [Solanum demissum]
MAQNEIEEMLANLRRMKSNGSQSSLRINRIEKLEMVLRVLRTFIKCHCVLFSDSSVKLTKNAKSIVRMLRRVFQGTSYIKVDKCSYELVRERQVPHLLEFFEGNTNISYNYELNDFDLSECMDCLGKNLNDMIMMFLERVRFDPPEKNPAIHRFIMQLKIVHKKMKFLRYLYATEINSYVDDEKLECLETRIQFMASNVGQLCLSVSVNVDADFLYNTHNGEVEPYGCDILNKPSYLLCLIVLVELEMKKIFLNELKASKFIQSKTFKDKKFPKEFSHHLHRLLMYLRNKKLENFPDNISAQNIDVAIEFLLVFLDADLSNHVINGNWLKEVMEKVGAIAGDVLYVIQKLLPSSINRDETSKISLFSLWILEKTKDVKAQVETYYKSLKFTPSQFSTFSGLSFLDSLSRKLNEMTKSKSGLDFLMKPLLGNLEKELSSLTSILEKELSSIFTDVTKVHHEHKIPKVLHRHTISLAYESEVAIDSILSQYNVFLHIFCSLPSILKEIKQINAELTEMWSADVALKPCYVVAPFKHLQTRHSNPVTDEEIVGFGNDTEKMIQYLIRGTNELDVVPIVGMGGQGKTTIARKVYNSDNIVSHFDVRAWCIISQTYNRRTLLQEIFSQVSGSKDKGDKDDILADKLRKILMGKRYLIVLDDMWDCTAWDDLRFCFPDVGNRSRIVVTTRLEKVGEQVKYHTDPYSLPFLTTEESCQLLQRKVFQQEGCPPELQYVSLEIAKKCKGLPLVVVLVAGIIKKRKSEESWWNEVKDALFDSLDSVSEEYSRATMQLSFDNLADCLKPCLLYMGMFPEDVRIRVSKLISLWVAEGFVQNSESAEDYLMDLINSNVVMVSKRSYNGKVKYCQVHDVVHHFCLEESRKEKFMLAVKGNVVQFQPLDWKGSRVSFSFSEKLSKSTSLRSKTQKPFHQHLRSLIGEYFDGFPLRSWIHKLQLLKVLDLRSDAVSYLSTATLKPLNHLKYLAVVAKKFYFDPESRLPHLETLMVHNYWDDTVLLPASFWEMEKLRHVDIWRAEFDLEEDKHGLSSKLEKLRILKNILRFPIDRMDVLSRRCPNLQQLHIEFYGGDSDSAESFCLTLENLTQLQIPHLSFGGPHIVSGLRLPSNLNKLVLSGTPIKNLISFIAGLPSLEYLQLLDMYVPQSEVWCLRDITFHKLKLLKLGWSDISRWDASEESFPLLETLVIKKCSNLEEIPLSFADILTLKQIKLIWCEKKSLEASAVRIKKDVEENEGNDRIDLIIKQTSYADMLDLAVQHIRTLQDQVQNLKTANVDVRNQVNNKMEGSTLAEDRLKRIFVTMILPLRNSNLYIRK